MSFIGRASLAPYLGVAKEDLAEDLVKVRGDFPQGLRARVDVRVLREDAELLAGVLARGLAGPMVVAEPRHGDQLLVVVRLCALDLKRPVRDVVVDGGHAWVRRARFISSLSKEAAFCKPI